MVNIFKSGCCKLLATGITTVAFTTVALAPPPLMAAGVNIDIATINFGIRVEKIYEKVKKAIDRGETNKIVGYMFDFKNEVEQYTGKKIDVDKQIDQYQKDAKKNGQKIDDKYIKQIKKDFKKEDKKHKHRAVWFAKCAEFEIPYTMAEADLQFDMNYMMMAKAAKYEQQEDVPAKIMVGVTVGLCGLFLVFVPIPMCQTAGFWLMNTGFGILASDALDKYDAYDRDNRKK